MVPIMIDDAEQRIYREVDFLGAVATNTDTTTAPGSRLVNWSNAFYVVEAINVITPAGTPISGARNPILPASPGDLQ